MELTYKERVSLSFQLMILEKIYPDEADHYKNLRTAIENGYTMQYDWFTDCIYKEELPIEKCQMVWDILSLYDDLIYSYNQLTDKGDLTDHKVDFNGFGGNHEPELMAYSRYILRDLDRFNTVKEFHKGDNFNSHMPSLDWHLKRLEKYRKIPTDQRMKLTLQQIKDIIE